MPAEHDDAVRALIARLMEAVESSLSGSTAVREALADIVRNGYAPRLYFVADAASGAEGEADPDGDPEAADEDAEGPDAEIEEPLAGLTKRDRDFLRSLRIRAEGG